MPILGFFLTAVLLASSCGADPAADAVLVDDFCAERTRALCAASTRCGCMVDAADCETSADGSCVLDRGRPTREMVDMGSLPYDPDAAGRYLASVEAHLCDERPTLCGATGPCLGLSAGGGACSATVGCAGDLVCLDGICNPPALDGATCTVAVGCTSGRCERGQCEPQAEVGGACNEETACASGNCDFATGRCRPKEPLDALCTEHSECDSGYCDRDLVLGAGNCRPVQALGQPCDEDAMCADGACLEGICGPGLCDDILP